MYTADTTHSTLMIAMSDLDKAREAIDSAKWAANVLSLLLTSAELGDDALKQSVTFLKANANMVGAMGGICVAGSAAIVQATSALHLARTKIPNTTPPRSDGLESFDGKSE